MIVGRVCAHGAELEHSHRGGSTGSECVHNWWNLPIRFLSEKFSAPGQSRSANIKKARCAILTLAVILGARQLCGQSLSASNLAFGGAVLGFLGAATLVWAGRCALLLDVDLFDFFLVLCQCELSELFLSLDEVYSHVPGEYFLKRFIQDGQSLHYECLHKELLSLLRVRELHEHLELLLLSEILNLDFGCGGLLGRWVACGMLWDQRLYTPLYYSDFHFILGLCLDVKFECVGCGLAVQDPQEEVHVAVVKFAVNRIRVCLSS